MCKHHFIKHVKALLRYEFKNAYRHPDMAFGAMDMTGTGIVNIEAFMQSCVIKRIEEATKRHKSSSSGFAVKASDIKQFCLNSNIFDLLAGGTMKYQVFKK